jgi:hypothetical protein
MNRAIGIWVAFGIALALGRRVLFEELWILAFLPVFVWVVVGVVLLGLQVWAARRSRVSLDQGQQGLGLSVRSLALRRSGVILCSVVLFLPVSWAGDWMTERVRFSRQRGVYDRIVAQVQGGGATRGDLEGIAYDVDPGPPVRVAFPWPGGIVDNWCGIVHDPTGDVMKVNAFTGWSDEWRASPVTKLFGGDMFACKVVDRPYYMCCFT